MKLTSAMALTLLMNNKVSGFEKYYEHPVIVGEAASRIAKKANLDEDKAKALGLIHDIGKIYNIIDHDIRGYEFILGLGYDEEYANICLTHSYLNNDIDCVAGGIFLSSKYGYEFIKGFIKNHKYTDYERIINLCDLMCSREIMTLDERLLDLRTRKGIHSNTEYHITQANRLKKEIEEMIRCDIYSLFPEISLRLSDKR